MGEVLTQGPHPGPPPWVHRGGSKRAIDNPGAVWYVCSMGLPSPPGYDRAEEMREFLLVVRRALLVIVRWIERRYAVDPAE